MMTQRDADTCGVRRKGKLDMPAAMGRRMSKQAVTKARCNSMGATQESNASEDANEHANRTANKMT